MKTFRLMFAVSVLFCFHQTVHAASETASTDASSSIDRDSVTNVDRAFSAYQRGSYLTAFELALPEAQNGNSSAQTLIAELYERGLGVRQNTKEAAVWYEIAAKSGNREAQFAYALKLLEGVDIPKDTEVGARMMKAASDAGHPNAMFNYATHRISQRPTSATYREMLPLLEKAAEYRVVDAYYSLAKIYEEGLATRINDPERGSYWMEKAADAGNDAAQVELAVTLLKNQNEKANVDRAFDLLNLAANSGNVVAQNRLAYMLIEGNGIERSDLQGATWHILASRAGRKDFDLDRYVNSLPTDVREQAIDRADRWSPSK
ncbi:MAG: tetratricopeptide repeat protein [Pseudomonadota bacterium]